MLICLDTSAFLKLYSRERGSQLVHDIVTSQSDPLPLWDILCAEMFSAFRLKVFRRELDPAEADRLAQPFDERLNRGQYFVIEVNRPWLMSAFRELASAAGLAVVPERTGS